MVDGILGGQCSIDIVLAKVIESDSYDSQSPACLVNIETCLA